MTWTQHAITGKCGRLEGTGASYFLRGTTMHEGNNSTPGGEGMVNPTAPPPLPGQRRMSDNTVAASLLGCSAIVPRTMVSGPGFVWGCQPKLLTTGAAFEGHPREG